jgi:hypothetical protein
LGVNPRQGHCKHAWALKAIVRVALRKNAGSLVVLRTQICAENYCFFVVFLAVTTRQIRILLLQDRNIQALICAKEIVRSKKLFMNFLGS